MLRNFLSFIDKCVSEIPNISKVLLFRSSIRESFLLYCRRPLILMEPILIGIEVFSIVIEEGDCVLD